MSLETIFAVLIGLVGVGFVVLWIFRGAFKKPLVLELAKNDPFPLLSTFLVGLTSAVAVGTLVDTAQPVVTGAVLGAVFGAIGLVAKATNDSVISRFGRAALVLIISGAAFWPAIQSFLTPACTTEPNSWFRPIVLVIVLVSIAAGLVFLFFGTVFSLSGSPLRSILAVAEGTLAFFSAFKIAAFFISPFGLALVDLPIAGSIVALLGILVLVIACVIAPTWVLRAGGILILFSNLAVFAVVPACGAPDSGEFFVIVGYCAVFGLLGFVLGALFRPKSRA